MLKLKFNTLPEPENNKRSVRIEIKNLGKESVIIEKATVLQN